MAITALLPSTTRLLGSSVNITSPADLVKELIDNAIDAQATSIEVTVSANTIDKVQVRDNGRGIAVDDFDCLGRRAHTSKLRSFDELKALCGKTLGFRGVALASANSISTVTITTRMADDPVASRLSLKFGTGGVADRRPVSAPVGTTVQAINMFESLPVRQQHALKDSQKSISKMKDLLTSYVLARPQIKMSLKLFGTSQPLLSYAPGQAATVRSAVAQLFGTELASSCIQVKRVGGNEEARGPVLEGFVPARNCDAAKFRGKGSHISVDSRPLNAIRGTAKKLAACFRSHLLRA